MIQDFIKELEGNQKINKKRGYENRIDIDYVIERLKDIQLDHNELNELVKSYKDLLEDEYKRKRKVIKYLNEPNRDDFDFSRAIVLEMLEGDI